MSTLTSIQRGFRTLCLSSSQAGPSRLGLRHASLATAESTTTTGANPVSQTPAPTSKLSTANPFTASLNQRAWGKTARSGFGRTYSPHVLYIRSTSNNTSAVFTHKGQINGSATGGSAGFKNVQRSTYEAGYQVTKKMFTLIEQTMKEFPRMQLVVVFKGFGQGREAFASTLLSPEGDHIRERVIRLVDNTPVRIGGPRAPKIKSMSRTERPSITGPEEVIAPFPIKLAGDVQKGFGRGGKDLGCPTANLPDESLKVMSDVTQTGVYYGYARVYWPSDKVADVPPQDQKVLPMVMSLGWNPFYKNERMTAELHLLHEFKQDFYGLELRAVVLGYVRPELDYVSREALIEDIETDKKVALKSLDRPGYTPYLNDSHF